MLLTPVPASAHGASVIQTDADYGPYHLVVVTSSATASNGLLLTVVLTEKVADPADLEPHPVTGATVKASIDSGGAHLEMPVPAEANRASSGYYETTLDIPGEGDASITLQIDGPKGPASTTFTLTRSAPWIGWLTFAAEIVFAGAIVTYILVFAANTLRARRKPGPSADLPTR
jgi:hypothetical protein